MPVKYFRFATYFPGLLWHPIGFLPAKTLHQPIFWRKQGTLLEKNHEAEQTSKSCNEFESCPKLIRSDVPSFRCVVASGMSSETRLSVWDCGQRTAGPSRRNLHAQGTSSSLPSVAELLATFRKWLNQFALIGSKVYPQLWRFQTDTTE